MFRPSKILLGTVFMIAAGLATITLATQSDTVSEALARPAIDVRNPDRAFMIGADLVGSNLVAVGERGLVLLSSDQGLTWRQGQVPVSTSLTAVSFVDAQHGMAVGHGGTVLGSLDGGETWALLLDGRRAAELAFADARKRNDASAIREAQRMIDEGPDKPFLDVLLQSPQQAIVVGAYGMIFATRDGGANWTPLMAQLDNPGMLHFNAIRQRGNRVLLVGEQGLVMLSTDAGRSFKTLDLPYEGSLFTAELLTGQALMVAGLKGNVWRSDDGGENWVRLLSPIDASVTSSRLLPSGELLLGSQAGVLMHESAGRLVQASGDRFAPINAFIQSHDQIVVLTADGIRQARLGGHRE